MTVNKMKLKSSYGPPLYLPATGENEKGASRLQLVGMT